MLSGNNFDIINNDTLVLPNTIQRLYLSKNKISKIMETFAFPNALDILDLSHNKLDQINNLPDNLRKLILDHNLFCKGNIISNFPKQLEFISLLHNSMTLEWLESSKLSYCDKLKYMNLNGNYLDRLCMGMLPSSLTSLALSRCNIKSIVGDFNKFENLQELDLSYNALRSLFSEMSQDPNQSQTQKLLENIRILNVRGNKLKSNEVKILYDKFRVNPNIQRLHIDDKMLSLSMDPSLLRPRKF